MIDNDNSKSIPQYNGIIAIFDVLGFTNFVGANPLDKVISLYAEQITSAFATSKIAQLTQANVQVDDIEIMVYSDTIAIQLKEVNTVNLINFINGIQLFCSLFFLRPSGSTLPIRGAITFGRYSWHKGNITTQYMGASPMVANNINFIVGNPIIEAHNLESKQQWIGTAITPSAMEELEKIAHGGLQILKNNKKIVEYNIPLKNGEISGWVINPTSRHCFIGTFNRLIDICKKEVNQSVKQKYFNTIQFLNYLHEKDYLLPYASEDNIPLKNDLKINLDRTNYKQLAKYMDAMRNEDDKRTNIALNKELIEKAFIYAQNISSKEELVEVAIKEYIINRENLIP